MFPGTARVALKDLIKKTLTLLAFAVGGSAMSQTVIYDTITGNTGVTSTGSSPRNRMADGFSLLTNNANEVWRIEKIELALYMAAAGTYTNISGQIKVWNNWTPAVTTGSVFNSLASDITWGMGNQSPTGVAAAIYTFDYLAANSAFTVDPGQNMGLEVNFLVGGVVNTNLALGIRDSAPTVGTSTNLFYRDANDNGIIENSDGRTITGWTNANAMIRITGSAQPVPEPATLAALGLGAVALIRKRRRK